MSNCSFPDWSIFTYFQFCFCLPTTYCHFFGFVLVNVPLVLPLCLYILVLGARQWRGGARGGARTSHTDVFTFNMVLVQLLGILGSCLLLLNFNLQSDVFVKVGIHMILVSYSAVVVFQMFTCVEHYLAVVHPVTYLRLKSQTETRNLSCAFAWLQCLLQSVYLSRMQNFEVYFALNLLGYCLSFGIAAFCNLSVIRTLHRPQPGGGAKGNTRQKAFYTITAIAVTLLVKFSGDVFSTLSFVILAKNTETDEGYDESCTLYFSFIWFTLPSSLVLPLLFLHRNEKLPCS